ncbi:MAG: ThiF family adenylyltransferase, partial [Planctomycetes bacterium]|nr:ThiF family adenylyltransferase [Planctomycetota bacterium]
PYLAAAGVGTIGLVDNDTVDESNLQRQVLFTTADVGRSKVDAARDRLTAQNPNIKIIGHPIRLTGATAMDIVHQYDLVVDASDNFPTRYLVNDVCVFQSKPLVFGAIHRFEGQASVFGLPDGPCYRCFFREPPRPGAVRTCAEEGVVGVLPGIVGSLQAAEALKLLLGDGVSLAGRLLLVDAWTMRFREIPIRKYPDCPVCGPSPSITRPVDYEEFCGLKRAASQPPPRLSPSEFQDLLARDPRVQVVEVREAGDVSLGDFSRTHVLPLNRVVSEQAAFDPGLPLVFVCPFGVRSETAARLLRDAGYAGEVFSLRDGTLGWVREHERPSVGGTA